MAAMTGEWMFGNTCPPPDGERRAGRAAAGAFRDRRPRAPAAIAAIGLLLSASAAVGQADAPVPAEPAAAAASPSQGAPPSGGPPAETPSAVPPGERPPAPPPLAPGSVVEAVDRTHESVAGSLGRTVEWFDSFFSDRTFLDEGVSASHFRLRTGARFRERDGTRFLARFHASLAMPGAERRFRLILEGRGEQEETGVMPSDPAGAEFDGGEAEQGALQAIYDFIRRYDVNASVRAGARFHFPIDPFLKLRLRYSRPLGTRSLVRLTQEGFVTVQEGPGETTRVDLERRLAPWTVLRWSASGTLADANPGYVWGSELSLFRQFTPRTAVTVEAGVAGQVEPVAVATNYVVKVRFRQNVFRPWLFYEVEPEHAWPRDALGAYRPTWGATLLVELQFGKPRETPPDGPPAPAQPHPGGQPGQSPGPG